jgi:predicted NBD/HSP70 family sugar kinase
MHALAVILGFDISPRRIAMASIDFDSERIITTAIALIPQHDDLRERRIAIKTMVDDVRKTSDIMAIFVEDAYPGAFKATIVPHAMSVGHCEAFLLERDINTLVMRLAPSTWRKEAHLPQQGKEPVMEWAKTKTDRKITQDEADAIGIATAGLAIFNRGTA